MPKSRAVLNKFLALSRQDLYRLCKANGIDPAYGIVQTSRRLRDKGVDPDSIAQVRGMTFPDPPPDGLEGVRAALEQARRPFFCTGTIPLDSTNPISILFRNKGNSDPATFTAVQFPLKSDDDIKPLLDASHQALFGRGDQNVLDPSYRKALVLHKGDFGVHPTGSLEPHGLGILTSISETLLESSVLTGRDAGPKIESNIPWDWERGVVSGRDYTSERGEKRRSSIIARLDKLNVYSEGDFFKGHVDTPSSEEMFGTLLINLPVEHEGGQLTIKEPLRGNGHEEFTTEWGKASGFEWVAFFSDCEHEVLPVTRGHRVTLTYTLSFEMNNEEFVCPLDVEELAGSKDLTRQALRCALQASGVFTPERPRLCFYMAHKYPMNGLETTADTIVHRLKGRDAVLYHALIGAGVSVSFHHVLYSKGDDGPMEILGEGDLPDDRLSAILPRSPVVEKLQQLDYEETSIGSIALACGARTPKTLGIVEVTQTPLRFVKIDFLTYGNEASLETTYGTVCMIATMKGYDIDEPWT